MKEEERSQAKHADELALLLCVMNNAKGLDPLIFFLATHFYYTVPNLVSRHALRIGFKVLLEAIAL